MKKVLSMVLAMVLITVLGVPVAAISSTSDGLTQEIAAAYLDVVNCLIGQYGKPHRENVPGYSELQSIHGLCGGYLIDLGDTSVPELIVISSHVATETDKEEFPFPGSLFTSIRVYTWDGEKVVFVDRLYDDSGMYSYNYIYSLCQKNGKSFILLDREDWGTAAGDDLNVTHSFTSYVIDGMRMISSNDASMPDWDDSIRLCNIGVETDNLDELYMLLKGKAGKTISVNLKYGIPNYDLFYNNVPNLSELGPDELYSYVYNYVVWTDARPFIDANNRTLVPLRAAAEALHLEVKWDNDRREAVFSGDTPYYNRYVAKFQIDSRIITVENYTVDYVHGGETFVSDKTIEMDTAAIIVGGRTYAPIRYLADIFGVIVEWDADTDTVTLTRHEALAT